MFAYEQEPDVFGRPLKSRATMQGVATLKVDFLIFYKKKRSKEKMDVVDLCDLKLSLTACPLKHYSR